MLSRRPLWSTARKSSALPLPALRRVFSGPPLINIQNGTFYRHYPTPDDTPNGRNPPLFPNLSFALPAKAHEPQHWAVIGAAGRTTLLDIFRGQLICLPPTARSYPFLLARKDRRPRSVDNAIQCIGFTGEGSGSIGGARGAYLSARYESYREETDWTVAQFLKGQTFLNPLEVEEHHDHLLSPIISNLQLDELLDMPVANLSNGQGKRARIAKALLNEPELLLLDGPFSKLSVHS
jgi:ABC-type molybdenum transport system ATPase subunit/photorepair protein PhrA